MDGQDEQDEKQFGNSRFEISNLKSLILFILSIHV